MSIALFKEHVQALIMQTCLLYILYIGDVRGRNNQIQKQHINFAQVSPSVLLQSSFIIQSNYTILVLPLVFYPLHSSLDYCSYSTVVILIIAMMRGVVMKKKVGDPKHLTM